MEATFGDWGSYGRDSLLGLGLYPEVGSIDRTFHRLAMRQGRFQAGRVATNQRVTSRVGNACFRPFTPASVTWVPTTIT